MEIFYGKKEVKSQVLPQQLELLKTKSRFLTGF